MKLLIDGDVVAYRAAFATEKTKYLIAEPDCQLEYFDDAKAAKQSADRTQATIWSRKDVQSPEQALMIADVMIRDIKEHYAAENPSVVGFLTGVGNYRTSIATRASYKGNRSSTVPPVHLKAVRQHLIDKHKAIVSQGEEADDLLGIAMSSETDSVCVSIDKDLMQLPGRHYNFVTKEEVKVSAKEAVINFYSQVLSGDATDAVPGLTGIGPVKARKALDGCRNPAECWRTALNLYTAEFGPVNGPAYALECAQLVYVRRKVGDMYAPPASEAKSDKKESGPSRVPLRARAEDSAELGRTGS